MARTVKGKKRFPFRIVIVPVKESEQSKPWINTRQWKYRAIYNMKMKLSIQINKASKKTKYKWYKFYSVKGYGAPSYLEFICPYSGMIAKTVEPEEAASIRRYWALCASKSKEILDWLNSVDPEKYTAALNSYLLRTIVVTYGIREAEAYRKLHPFQKPKPWQKLQSITK